MASIRNAECGVCYGFSEEPRVRIAEMKGFRFSLWSMFLGIAAVAIVCAALVKPTESWVMAFQAAALGVLTFALLAALVYKRGAARAFWIGFAVVGWGDLGLHRLHSSEVSLTREISERLKDAIHPYPPPNNPSAGQPGAAQKFNPGTPGYWRNSDPATEPVLFARDAFSHLGVWIWPLLLGFLGGIVAQQMYLRRERLAARAEPSGLGPISIIRQTSEVQKPGG